MTSPISAFNNQLIAFVEDLAETFPEEKDIKTAVDALKELKKANPKLLHTSFMEYIYPDFHGPVKIEDEQTLIAKARSMIDGEYKDYAFAYIIFDRYWSTMSDSNKKTIWNWCKVLVVLSERAAGITA
jgi:hypothetical protein